MSIVTKAESPTETKVLSLDSEIKSETNEKMSIHEFMDNILHKKCSNQELVKTYESYDNSHFPDIIVTSVNKNYKDVMAFLVKQGLFMYDYQIENLLYHVPDVERFKIIKYLVENFTEISLDALFVGVCHCGNMESIKYVHANGANLKSCGSDAIHRAAVGRCFEVVKYLIKNGVDIHSKNDFALRWTAWIENQEGVSWLVDNGANIHAMNDEIFKRAKPEMLVFLNQIKQKLENANQS